MTLWGRLWSLAYLGQAPWDIGGPRPELVHLVQEGILKPCRAIDLGCGIGENVLYLAQQGFDTTGIDISPRAIAKAQRKAQAADVSPTFMVGDAVNLTGVEGPFDLIVDNGCMHSLLWKARERYVQTVLRLTRRGSRYFLRCFEKDPKIRFIFGFVKPGEVERRFSEEFIIKELESLRPGLGGPLGLGLTIDATYLLIRRK